MNVVLVYSRLYIDCLRRAFTSVRKNPLTLFLPAIVLVCFQLISLIAGRLGFLGGILISLAFDALASCYLYFLGEVVANSSISLKEWRNSLMAYFWSIINVNFVIWIATMVLSAVLRSVPNGAVLMSALYLVAVVALNAAPEVIYQKGTYGGLATMQASLGFIQENWIEWLLPSLFLLAGFYYLMPWLLGFGFLSLIGVAIAGALIHLTMVFRGHLFETLSTSSHRQRIFKFKNAA